MKPDDFNLIKVIGRGAFGEVQLVSIMVNHLIVDSYDNVCRCCIIQITINKNPIFPLFLLKIIIKKILDLTIFSYYRLLYTTTYYILF